MIENMSLSVQFGTMPNGEIISRDLAMMPHLLVGGVSGSGKSAFLHSLVCSLVQSYSPEQVRFILMDPKCIEFGCYERLPHLFSPIVKEREQCVKMLECIETEINHRIECFCLKGCRNFSDFKQSNKDAKMPYLIVVIDEFSDLIFGPDGAFESTVSRIAEIGRSAGVHIVMATSRFEAIDTFPNLKANVPGRLVFRVCQRIDSIALLDECGAEELVGRGEALLKDGKGAIVRLKVPSIRDEAISRIVDSAIVRYPERHFLREFAEHIDPKGDYESIYERALGVIRSTRRASISCLQRQLNIGYNDAAHVMLLLEERGIIGPSNDNGSREIMCSEVERK